MPALAYLLARFSEPSSYAGLGAILALFGWNLSDTLIGQLAQALAAVCGLAALVLKERGLISAVLLAVAIAPALAGCGSAPGVLAGLGAAGSAITAADKLAAAASPYIATGCSEYANAEAASDAVLAAVPVPGTVLAKVKSVESFGDAACANPPAGDPLSTAIWLGQLAGQITTLASVAK